MWRYGWLVPVLGISFLVPGCGKSQSNTPKPTATPDQPAAGSARSGEASPQVVTDSSPAAGTPPTVASQPDIDLSPKPRQRQSEQQVRGARSQRQPSVRSEAPSVDTQPRVLESARLEVSSPDDSFPMEAAAPDEVAAEPARSELVSKELRFVKVFYGTNRVRTSACDDDTARWDDRSGCRPDDFYGVDAADASGPAAGRFGLDVGTLTVTFPDDHRKTKIERPFSVFGYELRDEDPSRDVVISELRSYSADYDSWLADIRGNGRRQAFIYVHGFANSFSSAARRAAQVAYDLDFDVEEEFQGLTMMFSWPSRGSVSPMLPIRPSKRSTISWIW